MTADNATTITMSSLFQPLMAIIQRFTVRKGESFPVRGCKRLEFLIRGVSYTLSLSAPSCIDSLCHRPELFAALLCET